MKKISGTYLKEETKIQRDDLDKEIQKMKRKMKPRSPKECHELGEIGRESLEQERIPVLEMGQQNDLFL